MKHIIFAFILALFTTSCSKKVEVKGKVVGGSPLERVEFINFGGVASLPVTNLAVDKTGAFSGSFDVPKSGLYLITYGGKQGAVYLTSGKDITINGKAQDFPTNLSVEGEGKGNNDFLKNTQKYMQQYGSKINMGQIIAEDEPAFLKEAEKIAKDLEKNTDEEASKTGASSDAVTWKKDELNASLLGLLSQYEMNHGQATQNPAFKVSKKFSDLQAKYMENNDRMVQEHPSYRNYLLGKMSADFQKFASKTGAAPGTSPTETFVKFLATQKVSQTTKDYLLGYIIAQSDIHPGAPAQNDAKTLKIIDNNIKDDGVKKDLKEILFVINGLKAGTALPESSLVKADGSKYSLAELKGKPALIMFYASWSPNIAQQTVPVLKEMVNFYKSKMNFAYVDLDDTKDQFTKTSTAMLSGIPGTNAYAEGGLNSDFAKKFGLYGFKLPGFLIIDKDGKVVGRYYVSLGDPEIVATLNQVSGLTAPQAPAPPIGVPTPNNAPAPPAPSANK